MKKIIFISAFLLLGSFALKAQNNTSKTDTIKVWGNCDMCETTIEKAAKKVKGVTKANWDVDKKILIVTYKVSETNNQEIQKAVANAGYDTEAMTGDDNAYAKLHKCCQYERKK